MSENCLSESELKDMASYEKYLSQKRSLKDKFEIKYDFGLCRICQDQATGNHYGVSTCESCKGFFKRSINKFEIYRCRVNKQCVIGPKARKKCKFCRWMNCVRAGMSILKIRMGRIPDSYKKKKLKKKTAISAHYFSLLKKVSRENEIYRFSPNEPDQIVPYSNFDKEYLLNLGEHQLVVLSLLKNKCYQLYRNLVEEFACQETRAHCLVKSGYEQNFEKSSDFRIELVNKDLAVLKKHARSMIDLIKSLPGFEQIGKHDLKVILNNGFFTTLGIRTIKLFIKNDYFLMLDESTHLDRELFGLLMSERVRDIVFKFFFALKSLHLTDQEYALLIPFTLTMNNENISKPNILIQLGEYYLRALFYEMSLNNRSDNFVENLAKTISWAPKMNKMCQDIELDVPVNEYC